MVHWTSDKDAILLVGIFEYANIKISKELCEALANKIGEGCTSKAVSHRLTNLKKNGNPTATVGGTPTKTTSAKSTPRNPISGRGKKTKDFGNGDVPMDDDEEIPSPSAGRKRGRTVKKDVAEEDEAKVKKMRLKTEATEDDDDFSGIIGGGWKDGSAKQEVDDDECV